MNKRHQNMKCSDQNSDFSKKQKHKEKGIYRRGFERKILGTFPPKKKVGIERESFTFS